MALNAIINGLLLVLQLEELSRPHRVCLLVEEDVSADLIWQMSEALRDTYSRTMTCHRYGFMHSLHFIVKLFYKGLQV